MNNFFENIDKGFIREAKKCMSITIDDISPDYVSLVKSTDFQNGMPGASWDIRYNKIKEIACEHHLRAFVMDRSIWKAILVFDENKKVLYVFMSTINLKNVIDGVDKGNKKHYLYLITQNCMDGNEQLSFLPNDFEEDYRRKESAKILGDLVNEIEDVVVVHYSYSRNYAFDGTLSVMDNTAHIREEIKIDDFLGNSDDHENEYHDDVIVDEVQQSPSVAWNPDKKSKKQGNDD